MKKEEKKEKAEREKEESERQQRAAAQEAMLSEKEQLRIQLEKMEEGGADCPVSKGEGPVLHEAAVEGGGSEKEVKGLSDLEQVTCADCA